MKEGWTYKKLGDVCNINSGKSIKSSLIHSERKEGFSPCYGGNGLRGYVEMPNCNGGNPIIGRVGAQCGNVHYCDSPFYATEHALIVTLLDKTINPLWLCHLFSSMDLKQYAEGAAQPVIAARKLLSLNVSIPPMSVQQRIVERLDAAFENIDKLKANAEKQLAEAQTLFQKSLAKAMEPKEGWEEKTLGQLGDLKNGMNFAHNEKGVDLHILGVGDFGNRFSIDDVRELQMISLNQQPSEDYLLKDGDIVFVRSNGNKQLVGRSLVVYPGDNSTTFSGFCIRFRKSLKVLDERFLVYLLKSDNTRKKLFGNGANISNLNQKTLQSLIVPLPPLAEQQRIVERLDALSENIRKYEEIQRQIISECDALKQALLRKVFE